MIRRILTLTLALASFMLACGSDPPSRCPVETPDDGTLCNSGGVVIYCHYDCDDGRGTDAYAICSGARWTVTRYDLCATDASDQ